jgi:hypothetical protein
MRAEHVAEAALLQRGDELSIGRALDVRRPIRVHRTADHEEFRRLQDLGHGAEIVAAARRSPASTRFG